VPKNTRRQSVLAKLETTYGTDAVPVAGTDGVLLANPSIPDYKLVQEYVERQGLRAYHGAKEQIPTKKYATIALMQELAGFGTAGPASPTPGYDALLRACGLSRTITASTKVDYTPVSTAHESATVVWNADGLNHKITGARGSLKISMNNNEIPMLTYDLMGGDDEENLMLTMDLLWVPGSAGNDEFTLSIQ
jgi:hypothetical protein